MNPSVVTEYDGGFPTEIFVAYNKIMSLAREYVIINEVQQIILTLLHLTDVQCLDACARTMQTRSAQPCQGALARDHALLAVRAFCHV